MQAVMRGYFLPMLILLLFITGCTQLEHDLKRENEQLKIKNQKLQEQLAEYEKTYELRNILDIKSRKIILALNDGNVDILKKEVDDNITVQKDKILIEYEGHSTDFPLLDVDIKLETLRQRYYHLDDPGKFVTGYELDGINDDRCVLVLTFIEGPSGWKLNNIETDR